MSEAEQLSLSRLSSALDRLGEALAQPSSNPLYLDGTIQRFEFCFELIWKLAKAVGRLHGLDEQSPREVLKAAFQQQWIEDEAAWTKMLEDRNLSSHTYREALATELYGRIGGHYNAMKDLRDKLSHALFALEPRKDR